jgi:CPA1 family monovalent cation:H+ antiporter
MGELLVAAAEGQSFDLALWGVLLATGALLLLAYRTGIPYPILLVLGGALVGMLADTSVELPPELVLVIFLPPLLYAAAFFSSLRDLRANARPISLLAIGAVSVTVLAVGVVAHAIIPGLSWPAAFTLGAVLSPTDPVAATAIASRVGAPRRFVTVVEGESLVNDSTGLIAYRFAIAATLSGTFSLPSAILTFVGGAVAGVGIGIAVGFVIAGLRRRIEDAPTEITISVLTPYFAYLPAEALGVSAVLAAVTAGIWLGWRSPQLVTPQTRIQAFAFWEILVFILNAALFILVGLQLPLVLERISDAFTPGELAGYAAAITLTLVAVRFLWVFPATYLPRKLFRSVREKDPSPPWTGPFLLAFTGMRGAVSLAAALAIPEVTDTGAPFPQRDLIIFLVYAAILVTVVVQGLALAPLIRLLGVQEDGGDDRQREARARLRAARAAIARIDEVSDEDWVRPASAERLRGQYEFRERRFAARLDDGDSGEIEDGSMAFQRLRREVLDAERQEIIRLRNTGAINDEVMHRIERDLDLEDARLDAGRS